MCFNNIDIIFLNEILLYKIINKIMCIIEIIIKIVIIKIVLFF